MTAVPRLNLPPIGTRPDGTLPDGMIETFARNLREWGRFVDDQYKPESRVGFRVRRDTNVAHATLTTIGLTWQTSSFQAPNGWVQTFASGTLKAPTATIVVPHGADGVYAFRVRAMYATSFLTPYAFAFVLNGVQDWHSANPQAALPAASISPVELVAGDTIVVNAFNGSASSPILDFAELFALRLAY